MKNITQSHSVLYQRYSAMADVLANLEHPTDDQKSARRDLDEQAMEHLRKANLLGERFLMVVSQ